MLYVTDVVTKRLAVEHLTGQPDQQLVGELLQLHLTRNPGAAFSTGTAFTEVLTFVAIIAVGVVLWLSRRLGSATWAVALAFLLAGVTGNLTDRMFREPGPFRGHVIDFLMLPNWPVFNVADICINVAAGLILVQAFRGVRIDGTSGGHVESAAMTDRRSTVQVPEALAGERVDAAIAQIFGVSRTRAADLIVEGLVAGRRCCRQQERPSASRGDARRGRSRPWRTRWPCGPKIVEGIRIIHDDDAIVVIDKPVGVAVHPSPGWTGPTVVGHLAAAGFQIATSGAAERQGIVQRLDVGTSGVMVICKSEHAYSVLKNAFRDRTVDKTYHALVQGHPDPLEGTVDAPIGRHPKSDWKFAVMADGRPSITHYSTLEAHRFASLLEVHLETGRTHQIRVHMAALKHPCVGRPPLRRRPHPGQARRSRAAVAACGPARLRAPGLGRAGRVRVDLPR